MALPEYSVPFAVAAGDFTGNGRTDLAVAVAANVSVLLGNGDGTFQAAVQYPVEAGTSGIVAGDFTGNGRLDLAATNGYEGNSVSVLLGNGDGTFQPPVNYAVGMDPDAIVAGDFSGNGLTDLAVANFDSDTVSVLSGNGDGTFQTPTTALIETAPIIAGPGTGSDGGSSATGQSPVGNETSTPTPTPTPTPPVISTPTPTPTSTPTVGDENSSNTSDTTGAATDSSGEATGANDTLASTSVAGGPSGDNSNPSTPANDSAADSPSTGSDTANAPNQPPEANDSASSNSESDGTTIGAAGGPTPAKGSSPNDRDAESTTTDVLPESLGLNPTAATRHGSDDTASDGPAQLLPLNETSLPLVGTLLDIMLDLDPSVTPSSNSGGEVELNVMFLPGVGPSVGAGATSGAAATSVGTSSAAAGASSSVVGQSLLTPGRQEDGSRMLEDGGEVKGEPIANPILQGPSTWSHFLPSIEEAPEQLRKENQAPAGGAAEPDPADDRALDARGEPLGLSSPSAQAIDMVLESLGTEQARPEPGCLHAVCGPEPRSAGSATVGSPLVLSAILIARAGPLAKMLRDHPRRAGRRERSDARLMTP